MLKDVYYELKKDIRELEHENKILKSEKTEIDMSNLVLHKTSKKEDVFAKFKNESLELNQKIESLLVERKKLLENLK